MAASFAKAAFQPGRCAPKIYFAASPTNWNECFRSIARHSFARREAADNYPRGNEMREKADYVLSDVMDQLDDIASREGMTFGAHEGDGADFGYWKLPEEEQD